MILVTGATGNTGGIVLDKLLRQKGIAPSNIVMIARRDVIRDGIITEIADMTDEAALAAVFAKYNISRVIHIANIRFSPLIMELAEKHGVQQVILVHTTGIYSKYRSYSELYKEIEQEILASKYLGLNYTILRPTMIYGNDLDHNMHKLIKVLNKTPIFPLFGKGDSKMQPVHVEDLAEAIVTCLDNPINYNKAYDFSGGSVVTYRELVVQIIELLERKVLLVGIPIKLAILGARILELLPIKRIVSVEQIERLQEDKVYCNQLARDEIGFSPRSFSDGITEEVEILRTKGLI